ncbi:MAG: EAL domain-containing protein [Gammaproteobacteria bacterium]|nr:EAL domain-containing protein [Gammaproteobacteria bacterium]
MTAPEKPPVFWLGRQPILDRREQTVAYELLFRSGDAISGRVTDNRMATASVITHAFNELGIESVLGTCRGFINFDADLLLSDTVELLPPERTVVELLETVDITPAIVARCHELRALGFSFALDDVVQLGEHYTPVLPLIDIIKVDVLATPPGDLPAMIARARGLTGAKLLAEKVDSPEQARRCRELGFDLFQGYFFARPAVLEGRRVDPSRQVLVQLLQQVLTSADNRQIEATFKQAPELSYKLMRLVNSIGMGLRFPIASLSHALVFLGQQQLQRWVQLLLFAQRSRGTAQSPLLGMAATRGRLMELLAEKQSGDVAKRDRAFMAGILSLLDVLLETRMEDLIAQISLPGDVRDALLARAGPLGHLLKVVEALEQADSTTLPALLANDDPCRFDDIAWIQVKALAWSNAIAQAARGG